MSNSATSLASLKEKLSHFKLPELSSSGLLVFQSGSFGLRAALFKADKDYASIKAIAESRQVDFTRAIAEIHQTLIKQHSSIPRRCILISPSLLISTLSLPVTVSVNNSYQNKR